MPWEDEERSEAVLSGSAEGLADCKYRLDASVEENRRNRHVIEELNEQVARFRRRNADADAARAAASSSTGHLPSSTANWHFSHSSNNLHDDTFVNGHGLPSGSRSDGVVPLSVSLVGIDGAGAGPATPSTMMANTLVIPIRTEVMRPPKHHRSSPTLYMQDEELIADFDAHAIDRLLNKLNQESYKNDALEEVLAMLRVEAQKAHSANHMLREDVSELSRALETVQAMRRNDQAAYAEENSRVRRRHEQQNRALLELWHAFKAHRTQMADLRVSTQAELDRQLMEFKRAASLMQTTVAEARQKTRSMAKEDDTLQEMVGKYEKLLERNLETEKNKAKTILSLESSLKKAQDEREILAESLTRIAKMPELSSPSHRTRSMSPTGASSSSSSYLDIQRRIRTAIGARATEAKDLETRVERADKEVERLRRQLERTEAEGRGWHEDKRSAEQREKKRLHDFAELERSLKRSVERVAMLEEEKKIATEEIVRLQKNLTETLRSHKDFIEDLANRHRDELADRVARVEADAAERIAEIRSKLDRSRDDSERDRGETEKLRLSLREANAQLAVAAKRMEETTTRLEEVEGERTRLRGDWEAAKRRVEEEEGRVEEMRATIEERTDSETKLMERITKLSSEETLIREESRSLSTELVALKKKIEELVEHGERQEAINNELRKKLAESDEILHVKESKTKSLKASVASLESRLEEKTREHGEAMADLQQQIVRLDMARRDFVDAQGAYEELSRERDALSDALESVKIEATATEAKLAHANKTIEERDKEELELRRLVEAATEALNKAQREIGERERMGDALKQKIAALELELVKTASTHADDQRKSELRFKEDADSSSEGFKGKIRVLEAEKLVLEQAVDVAEKKLGEIEGLHEQLIEEYSDIKRSADEWKEKHEQLDAQRRRERDELTEANAVDREEWEVERTQLEKQRSSVVAAVREELEKAEAELRGTQIVLDRTKKERDEALEEIEAARRRADDVRREGERQSEAFSHADAAHTHERHALLARLEEAAVATTRANSLLDQSGRKATALDNELAALQRMLTEKSKLLVEVETSLDGLASRLREADEREHGLRDRLAVAEGERAEWKRHADGARANEAEATRKANELQDRVRELQQEVNSMRAALDTGRQEKAGRQDRLVIAANKMRLYESQLGERTTQLEAARRKMAEMEDNTKKLRAKGDEHVVKMDDLSRTNEQLRRTVATLKDELASVAKSLEGKSSTSRVAMDELLVRYRDTDSRLVEAQAEIERMRGQSATQSAKLERAESRRAEIEHRLALSEGRRDELAGRIAAYEKSARNALSIARPHTSGLKGSSTVDLSLPPALSPLRTALSTHDLYTGGAGEPMVRFDSGGALDVSTSVDITIRFLKERIDRLEEDKAKMAAAMGDHARCTVRIEEAVEETARLQRRILEMEEEKKHLEGRLHSQRSLYLSNEESMASKEREGRSLRAKLASTELRVREREAHLQQLSAQLEAVRSELKESSTEKSRLGERCRHVEETLSRVEEERASGERRRAEAEETLLKADREMQSLLRRLEESESACSAASRLVDKLKMDIGMEKETTEKLKQEEEHWRNTAHTVKRTAEEYKKTMLDERLAGLQRNYDDLNGRNEKVVEEAERLRKELREANGRAATAAQKVAETERRLDELSESRKSLHTRLLAFERKEGEWARVEGEMADELKALRKDKLTLTAENEEAKRKITRLEVERREIEVNRTRLEREVAALKKHSDTLEEERSRREITLKEALAERKAIDKSLASMERENAELYRSCTSLQAQIAGLERDTGGARSVTKLLKEHADVEGRLARSNQEKRQMELTFAQRETNHSHRQRMLEGQISMLKEQLETERKKRMEDAIKKTAEVVSRKISGGGIGQRKQSPFRS